jgi:hypothetical protein
LILDDTFLRSPKGLGFKFDNSINNYNLTRRISSKKLAFEQFQGEMIFNSYSEYKIFVDYIMSSQELSLIYNPDGIEYYCKVEISQLDKSEIDKTAGKLICIIAFDLLGYWTREETTLTGNQEVVSLSPNYPLNYTITYGTGTLYSSYIAITLTNNGHSPAPLKISITGLAINPTWEIGNQKGKLLTNVQSEQVVEIDSREDKMKILSGETVLDSYKNHTLQNYIYAPIGDSVLLLQGVITSEVTIYEQYSSI